MNRKMLSLLLVLVLTLGAFGTTAFAADKKVLKVAMSSGDLPVDGTATIEKMFAKFEEENDCDVELVVIAHDGWSDYLTKLQTMMVSGNAPDVFQNPHEGGRMANALGIVAPLDEYIEMHPEKWEAFKERCPEWLLNARLVDGKIYGLADCFQRTVIWFNKDRLAEAGLEVPAADWTWEEFEHYLEVLSQPKEDGTKQYAIAIPDYYFVYNQWLYSFGTGFLNDEYNEVTFDSKESIELMQFLADCVAKGYAPVPDKNYDYLQQLIDGYVAMTNAGRWMLKYCSSNDFYNVAAVEIPHKYSGRQEYAIGSFEVISSTSNYELASAFAFYTVTDDWEYGWVNDTANIASITGIETTDELSKRGYVGQELFDVTNMPAESYPMQSPVAFTEISNIFDRCFSSVMSGEVSAEEACKAAAEEMRAAIAQ